MLFIIVENQKILSYGKDGDIEITSWPLGNGDPARKSKCWWNGSIVQLKTTAMLLDEYRQEIIDNLKLKIRYEWLEVQRTMAEIKTQYDNFKINLDSCEDQAECYTLYLSALTWLGLEE